VYQWGTINPIAEWVIPDQAIVEMPEPEVIDRDA
jgi:hypothetical protein